MTAYLIKSILCLLVLWGFYKVALEQTAAHQFKRFYLLGSLAIALALPLITFFYTVEVEPQPVNTENFLAPTEFNDATVVKPIAESTNWLLISLGIIYGSGVLLFGFRFLRNLLHLREKVRHNEHVKAPSHINVLLVEHVIPHSFLKYIFLPKTDFKNNVLPAEVLQHEHAHVIQKHSWDILFIEFLQVVFWFNPLLILLKKSVALNHEFLADQAALQQENNITNYTNLLFNYSGGAHHTALSSPINYSLTKKRILMLSKTRSVKKLTTRIALFVPVLALCVYFFNQEIVAKPKIKTNALNSESIVKPIGTNSNYDKGNTSEIELYPIIDVAIDKNQTIYFDNTQVAVDDLDAKIETILKTTLKNTQPEDITLRLKVDENLPMGIMTDVKDVFRQKGILKVTTTTAQEQKKKPMIISQAELNAISKSPTYHILEKKSPTSSQLKKWKDASQYGVWVDGKRISNASLKSPEAYSHYFTSKLEKNTKNYGSHYFQVNLMTPAYYESHKQIQNPPSLEEIKAYLAQNEKVLKLTVTGSRVWLNEEETSVENFANDLDALSKDWTLNEKKNFNIHVRSSNPDKGVWKGLQKAFKTTALYKANPKGLMPPPPPPAPAPPKANSIPAPPPPPAPVNNSSLEAVTVQGLPAPPPPPASPEEMARLADSIYYNDKKITAEKAESLMKESENYNVLFTKTNGKHLLIIKDK